MIDFINDVKEFNEKFGLTYKGRTRFLPSDVNHYRTEFMREELNEYVISYNNADLAGQLDALVDLMYVVIGTAEMQGFDLKEAWARVHAANMTKVRATDAIESKRNHILDVVKPEGWKAPNLNDLIDERGVKGIILLEGPDDTGKSTFANELVDKYDAWLFKNDYNEDADKIIPQYYGNQLNHFLKVAETQLVVVDRWMLSEMVYGSAHRDNKWWYECDGLLRKFLSYENSRVVFFQPNNLDEYVKSFRLNTKEELYRDKIEMVWHMYKSQYNSLVSDGYKDLLYKYDRFHDNRESLIYNIFESM